MMHKAGNRNEIIVKNANPTSRSRLASVATTTSSPFCSSPAPSASATPSKANAASTMPSTTESATCSSNMTIPSPQTPCSPLPSMSIPS